jgi:hypothetical protein
LVELVQRLLKRSSYEVDFIDPAKGRLLVLRVMQLDVQYNAWLKAVLQKWAYLFTEGGITESDSEYTLLE